VKFRKGKARLKTFVNHHQEKGNYLCGGSGIKEGI